MKNWLIGIATLLVTSLTMRFLPAFNPPLTTNTTQHNGQKALRPLTSKTVYCYYESPQCRYSKTTGYRLKKELHQDIVERDLWLGYTLFKPVKQEKRELGIQLFFKSPNPFSRLGLLSGDILIGLNSIDTTKESQIPEVLREMRSAPSLHFRIERAGKNLSIDPHLI